MIKNEKETNNLIDIRDRQKELRDKQAENEEFLQEIEKLNTICFALSGNIKFEREKNESLEKEVQFRKNHLEKIKNNCKSFEDKNNKESKGYVEETKNKMIKKRLEELLVEKIPELNISNIKNDNNQKDEENEFHNLVIDHVNLIYIQYDLTNPANEKSDKQSFRISNKSDFKSLKKIACHFWDLDNENDYVITDEAEALLYNEEMTVDSWLRDYSVLANTFKLLSINTLKVRNKLMGNQENRMKDNNKFSYKGAKRENVMELNMAHDSSKHKIKEFFNYYVGLKPFTLITDDKGGSESGEKKIEDAQSQAKKIETSFWMLLILVLFFVLNLYFIYGSRDIGRNNLKINFVRKLFDHSNVNSYISLYNYLITKIGFNFNKINSYDYDNYLPPPSKDTNPWIKNTINAFETEGVDYENWFIGLDFRNSTQIIDPRPLYEHIIKGRESNYFVLASSVHLISTRVNFVYCSDNPVITANILNKNENCYDTTYNSVSRQTDFTYDFIDPIFLNEKTMLNYFKNLTVFRTASNASIYLDFETLAGQFDGSGYHLDLVADKLDILDMMVLFSRLLPIHTEFNKPTNSSGVDAKNNIDTYFLVDKNVRSLIILFTIYFPFEDNWMSCVLSIDFLPTGTIAPGILDFKIFRPNIYTDGGVLIADIIRLIIIIIFILFMVIEYFEKVYDKDSFFDLFLSTKTILNLLIFILFFISFIIKLVYCYNDETAYFSTDKSFYKDTSSLASYYNQIYYYESLLFAAMSIKILTFLRLNDHVQLFFNSIEMGVTIFVKYCFFLIVILVGYACIAHILWGPFIDDFRTFGNSFLQILFFTMGYYNPSLLLTYNSAWTVVFIGSFFLFVLYFMYAIFISIYAESLRRTVIKLGYPEDHQLTQWTLKDYIVWLCYCIGGNKKKEEQNS